MLYNGPDPLPPLNGIDKSQSDTRNMTPDTRVQCDQAVGVDKHIIQRILIKLCSRCAYLCRCRSGNDDVQNRLLSVREHTKLLIIGSR